MSAPYILHYTSADGPGDDATWSVYRELYVSADAEVPIDGSQEFVSTHASEAEADAEANRLQDPSSHGAVPTTWFGIGLWPTCRCGFDPRDNRRLTDHWAGFGFRVVDEHGELVRHPLAEAEHEPTWMVGTAGVNA